MKNIFSVLVFLLALKSFHAEAVSITVPPHAISIASSSITIEWQTDVSSTGYIIYGRTTSLELGAISSAGAGTSHSVSITGANPAEVFYARAYAVSGVDTNYSAVITFITASLSSGEIICYFNQPVETTAASSPANYATQLQNLFDDTLAAYIDRAQSTLDIAIYNFGNVNTAPVINAINNAYSRGVKVRIISEGGNSNTALPLINAAIPKLSSPTSGSYGYMHNKFMIIDLFTSNPDDAVLWTGSANWTDDQLNTDPNNIIIFRDQSIARAYRLEFNEMWGDTGMTYNLTNSRFGQFKTDNTPHQFVIGGNNVECYFSPSDGVTSKIANEINNANNLLCFSVMAFTRTDLASAVAARASSGVNTYGMVEDTGSGGGNAFLIMQAAMNNDLREDNHSYILHHKYMIADQGDSAADPLVLTGSHNWSTSAETRNDENTVIVHDRQIANQYFQEFVKRFSENGGVIGVDENEKDDFSFSIYPNPASTQLIIDNGQLKIKSVDIFDVLGHKILQAHISYLISYISIDISSLSPGIYFLQANAGRRVTVKLIVQ
ncbi:MAG TPA: phospholipase D-like domain-containing protein [Bacteroidia bacterium]|nr:phospholipase D-like domain-containing protein [Bacteroidia bacterium]